MSSLVRSIEKRLMKRAGFTREKWILGRNPLTGEQQPISVLRGGEITDPDDNPIGRRWPSRIPARVMSRTLPSPRKAARVLRALRRAKPNKRWLARRARLQQLAA